AEELHRDSFLLANNILQSGFRPDYIVGIWRGGTPVGIAVQEFLDYSGIETDHIAIRTSHYTGIDQTTPNVQVHGLGYLIRKVNKQDSLLIVDDVFDTGMSAETVIVELSKRARLNTPGDIRIATPWYKPSKNKTGRAPDYFIHETAQWLVFPHELTGLTPEEVCRGKPEIADIIASVHTPKLTR
ncbi:MAG TPA: hypoxanthine phosphoribosyltransferase, partial [Gammaproteobacteria bacterium]|nr:hypoxanthine phosphoribosyltransferase [Gammaproteobacteria bacterium]HIO33130.1 hypoxanthine phosphoribosyltransferase [Gammaproteobacteria bacterium]